MFIYKKIRFLLFLILGSISFFGYSQTVTISGTVTTPNGKPLDQVEVSTTTINGTVTSTTDTDGNYTLEVPINYEYTLNLQRDTDLGEGLSVSDMFKMRKHILAIENLEPLYQIAADLNNDGNVTSFDMLMLKIFLITGEPFTVPSWRLFRTDDPTDISTFVEAETGILGSDLSGFNFIGLKSGNVDCH